MSAGVSARRHELDSEQRKPRERLLGLRGVLPSRADARQVFAAESSLAFESTPEGLKPVEKVKRLRPEILRNLAQRFK